MKHYYIETFGCQMNVHDSEKMTGILRTEGYTAVGSAKDADIVIFNTCSIRQKAEQKFFSEPGRIKSLKKKKAWSKNSSCRVYCPAGREQDIKAGILCGLCYLSAEYSYP